MGVVRRPLLARQQHLGFFVRGYPLLPSTRTMRVTQEPVGSCESRPVVAV